MAHLKMTVGAILLLFLVGCSLNQSDVFIASKPGAVVIANEHVKVEIDLANGTYDAIDLRDGTVCVRDAFWQLDAWSSKDPEVRHAWKAAPLVDELGAGKTLTVTSERDGQPDMILQVAVYDNRRFVAMAAGIDNQTGDAVLLKKIQVVAGGEVFRELDKSRNFRLLDGYGGGEPLEWGAREYTALHHGTRVLSRNNLLLTFGENETRRALIAGGLTYSDYEKFAHVGQSRKTELAVGPDGKRSLLCYLNLAEETSDGAQGKPALRLVQGDPRTHSRYANFWCPEFSSVAVGKDGVILEATGLSKTGSYTLGFSWWNLDKNDRIQTISADGGEGTPLVVLLDRRTLPMWNNPKKEDPHQAELAIPASAHAAGKMRILIESATDDPYAVVSEIWLRDGAAQPLFPATPTTIDQTTRPRRHFDFQLYAEDPVGKRVDPGVRYIPADRFYLDFVTRNPFEAAEQYGRRLQQAQKIDLPMYDFPTVCLWYAHHGGYGGGKAKNDTPGAVAEIENIARTGFLKYSRAAVRLVPDSYTKNSQQGWWDEKHFQMYGSTNLGEFEGGQYKAPYETSEKWGKAVTARGGIPLIYFQTGFRSEDYAEAFPEHMLFNKSAAWKNSDRAHPKDDEKFWSNPWGKNGALWNYDYTDPGFVKHMREVYANLRGGGVKGLMFDYPGSGWAAGGGMEDKYATTAAAYRNIFRLANDGLGPGAYVHERNMERGSDVSLGLVASSRTENDTDRIRPGVVTRCGLRWYKNRVVVNYDTDSKNLLRAKNRDGVRSLLTLSYTTTGRLLLANSFVQLSPETLFDLTRVFPFHTTPLTARPVDAFTEKYPRIYDFRISPQWHQLVLYNTSNQDESEVSVALAGDTAECALGLDAVKQYYVYDFWNDRLVGKLPGAGALTQTLRPDEARMLAVHEAADHPQFISTNRHLMQGYVDLKDIAWNSQTRTLAGSAAVVGGETYTIVIATNGHRATGCGASSQSAKAEANLETVSPEDGLIKLGISVPENRDVAWTVSFK